MGSLALSRTSLKVSLSGIRDCVGRDVAHEAVAVQLWTGPATAAMSNYYSTLSTLAQYDALGVGKADTAKSPSDNLRGGLVEADALQRPSDEPRVGATKRRRSSNSRRISTRQRSGGQPGMRLGPSDPLPGPYFNLISADDDDDTEYEPGTDEEEEASEEELEEDVDPEEWILDPDKDFFLPEDYVLPPYLDSLPPELQMFAPEPPRPREPVVEKAVNTYVPPSVSDISYRVNPYHYTSSKKQTSMKELLSNRRDELQSLKSTHGDSEALAELQKQYFRSVQQRELEMGNRLIVRGQPSEHKRTPHNAGTTSNDTGVEMYCGHCDRVFRGPRASTHKQQHTKRLHPGHYVKKKG